MVLESGGTREPCVVTGLADVDDELGLDGAVGEEVEAADGSGRAGSMCRVIMLNIQLSALSKYSLARRRHPGAAQSTYTETDERLT